MDTIKPHVFPIFKTKSASKYNATIRFGSGCVTKPGYQKERLLYKYTKVRFTVYFCASTEIIPDRASVHKQER